MCMLSILIILDSQFFFVVFAIESYDMNLMNLKMERL